MHLIAIDPAKTKPSWGARFIDGKFIDFIKIDYKELVKNPLFNQSSHIAKQDMRNICLIERPYVHPEHSPASQIGLALACGEIAFYMRRQGFEIEYIETWGNTGWLSQFFGQRKSREYIMSTAKQIVKYDKIAVKNDDQVMAYCLGLWWDFVRG